MANCSTKHSKNIIKCKLISVNRPISKYLIFAVIILVLGIMAYIFIFRVNKKELKFPDIVSSPDMNSMIASGKTFVINLNEKKLENRDSVVLISGNNRTTLKGKYIHEITTSDMPLGYNKIIISVFKGTMVKTIDLPFIITSDIKPVPLNFTQKSFVTHDTRSYTQGLEMYGGILYESAGQYQESTIRKVNPISGEVIKSIPLAKEYFGEGLTVLHGKVYQLTWKEATCLVYDKDLNLLKKTNFRSSNGEGWGLCNDGKSLIISDGSNKLTYIHPETFAVEKIISVYAGANEVQYLNELEYVDGYIYANVYTTNQIAKIEAQTGKVIAVSDMSSFKNENQDGDVLNCIAFNPASGTFLITGKYWKKMYEVKM